MALSHKIRRTSGILESVTYAVCHDHGDVPLHLSTDRSHEEQPIREIYWRFIERTLLPFEQYAITQALLSPLGAGEGGGGGEEAGRRCQSL